MEYVHIAVAVIHDAVGRVLITKRGPHQHLPGKWEFPGGKVESHETPLQALDRELREELGVTPQSIVPLIQVEHAYSDRHVTLHVYEIIDIRGKPQALEDQQMCWYSKQRLAELDFPQANHAILKAISLPDKYLISPEPGIDRDLFLQQLGDSLRSSNLTIELVQFRAPNMPSNEYLSLASRVAECCSEHEARLLLNAEPDVVARVGAQGVHLNSARLLAAECRPLGNEYLVAASCHNTHELKKAVEIDADFVVLSPVKSTPSHPGLSPVGWSVFQSLCGQVNLPVFALGGMHEEDISIAREAGGQGVAGISAFWKSE